MMTRATPLLALSLLVACSSGKATVVGTGGGAGAGYAGGSSGVGPMGSGGGGGASSSGDAGQGGATAACARYLATGAPASAWAYAQAGGTLGYKALDAAGDRIMDFSYAGYMGGGVAIPDVPTLKTVSPSGGDDTAAIQAAIDAVSALPLDAGVRGAVLLAPGAYTLAGSLSIAASGVVLRGSGSGSGGTVLTATGTARQLMTVRGSGSATVGASTGITDAYVPSGATSFHVADAGGLAVGDAVYVYRPVTTAWIDFMGMNQLVGSDGGPQVWFAVGDTEQWDRTVTAIAGSTVTLDVPLSDSLDARYVSPPGASVARFTYAGRISQVGIEDLRFVSPVRSATTQFSLVRFNAVADGWVRRVAAQDFTNGIWLGPAVKRFTVEDVPMTHDATTYTPSEAPFDFWIEGSQTLVQRSSSAGGDKIWYYATQMATTGPNVLLDFTGTGTASHVTAHNRWATGWLVDSGNVSGGVMLENNGTLGSGEGWSAGWGVVWNTVTDATVEAPPGAMNWAIGVTGAAPTAADTGTYESMNVPVTPGSLYLAQLCVRLGPAAVAAIGD